MSVFNSVEMQQSWVNVLNEMCAWVDDNNADVDMAHDWVCEMLDIDSFVDNNSAWESFIFAWNSCDNRNCTEYNFA